LYNKYILYIGDTKMENIKVQAYAAAKEIIEKAKLSDGDILVVGCSTSEVIGNTIGTNSSPDTAEHIYIGVAEAAKEKGVYVAAQCCEHLNRAIIVSRKAAPFYATPVNVVPQPKAGGSFATAAYKYIDDAVALEEIEADAGLDIGFTMIGMHIKSVAVPVRLENNIIGKATVLAARSRPKFIGGARAVYNDNLL
jgi:uncharacterized protein (TIGR01440 family)